MTHNSTRYIGAHASMAGGHAQALVRVHAMGGNILQCFSSSPKSWAVAQVTEEAIAEFRKTQKELNIRDAYFHASYLINLANAEKLGNISKHILTQELNLASQMGVRGSIIHLGSYKAGEPNQTLLLTNIEKVLTRTPTDTYFIIENAGNRKIGLRLEEIGEIIKAIRDRRVRVCLDVCHLFAAGYDLSTDESYKRFKDDLDRLIGLAHIEAIHMNDSKGEFGAYRDLHENIGQGKIDASVYPRIINDPDLHSTSMIVEVPGFDGKGSDKQNIDILKGFIQ